MGGGVGGLALTHKAVGLLVMCVAIQVELGLWAANSTGVGSSSKGSPSFLPGEQALFHLNASAADQRLVHSKKRVDKAGYGNPLSI